MKGPYKLKSGETPIEGYTAKTITYRMAYPKKKAPAVKKRAPSKKNVTVRKPRKTKSTYNFAVKPTGTRVTF